MGDLKAKFCGLFRECCNFSLERFNPLAADRYNGYYGTTQLFTKRLYIDFNATIASHIHHIESNHHGYAHFSKLHGEIEVSFQVGGIEYVDDHLRIT